jgi:NADPH-dependent curcumin reductase CurA
MQTTPPSAMTQFRLVKYPSGPGFEGIDAFPEALTMLFAGKNEGKLLIEL